jgi:hypothetical protein
MFEVQILVVAERQLRQLPRFLAQTIVFLELQRGQCACVAGAEEAVAGMQQAASLIAGYSSLVKYKKSILGYKKLETNNKHNNKKPI